MKKILDVSKLKKIYHTNKEEIFALKDINFDVFQGEFISIVGPSGCGKSTILSILCNFYIMVIKLPICYKMTHYYLL